MKKITFLMLHLNYGGIEKQVTTLANELSKKYDVKIISLYDILDGKSFYNLNDNVNVKYVFNYGPNKKEIIKCLKSFKVITFFKEIFKAIKILYTKYFGLRKIINSLDTDILISSRIEFSKQVHRDDIITIAQEHSFINTDKYIKKVKKSFSGIDYLVVMTKKAKEKYELWLKDCRVRPQVIVIPNMVKENKDGQVSSLNNNQIVSIGRLELVKDFYTLILVFSILIKKYPKLVLKIIGEGSQRNKLEELVSNCNLQNNVVFTGKLTENQINEELLRSDIFVLTSKSESFSLVLYEAMNFGVPCVTFDVDVGPREIIDDGINGFLVNDRNVDLMVKRIENLLENKSLKSKMGIESVKKVKKFYPINVLKKWEDLFNK